MNARWICTRLLVAAIASIVVIALPAQAAQGDQPAATETQQSATGIIEKLDATAHTLTIKGLLMSKTFQVADDAVFATKDKPQALLSDFKAGDRVEVTYENQDGKLVAH